MTDDITKALYATSSATGIDIIAMLGRSRLSPVNDARQIAMLIMKSDLLMSYRQIGRVFERDKNTAINGVRSIRNKAETDPEVASAVHDAKSIFKLSTQ